ncbi:MAG: RHS repeat-associated core domain-containing protein, partial [Phycisphaeraceae bacterium]|nr:RHS repeat-associated core domain-containing protein [Phycisphaeraceae bacterium]
SDSDFASGPWNPIGYDGYVYDDAADMSAVRFRWYDAKLGRWVSRDPAGYVDGTSLYQYGQSNSLKYSDPSGLRIGVVPNMKQQDRDAIAIMLDDLCPGAKWNHYGSSTIGSQEGGNGRMRGTSEEQPLQESTGLPNA